jgi:DNA-binding response OmpR family regulator
MRRHCSLWPQVPGPARRPLRTTPFNMNSPSLMPSQHPAHVLVVEDSQTTAYLLSFILERAGYRVTCVDNGREAERLIQEGQVPDAVILDLILPYVDGFQLLMQMRESQSWKLAPVIVLSIKALEADVVRAFEIGADDFVTKPFRPQELLARLRRLLGASADSGVGR